MRKRYIPRVNHNSEFDLDLAPLLAVMVKLVPVMLISSAFVQMMIVETELPQIVKAAIEKQDRQPTNAVITVTINKKYGIDISVDKMGDVNNYHIALTSTKNFDYVALHEKMQEVKIQHPETYKVQFEPTSDVTYKEIVKMMDEVRQSHKPDVRFPIKNQKTGEMSTTDYMFPEVVFSQMTEG